MTGSNANEGVLAGVLVVEFAHLIAGPSAAMQLQELGADVIKLESEKGDRSRALNRKGIFNSYNRGKSSIVLDLRSDEGHAAAIELLRRADVFIEATQPGVMQRLRLSYDDLKKINERLIYVSNSAFNADGPDGQRAGLDAVLQAECGIMAITGEADGPPIKVGAQVVDAATGIAIVQAVLAAMLRRTQTGRGQHIKTSLFDVGIYLQAGGFADYFLSGDEPRRQGNTTVFGYPTDIFNCADGYLQMAAYFDDRWRALCDILGVPELPGDPRFVTNELRLKNRTILFPLLNDRFKTRARDHWRPLLVARGIPAGDIRTYSEIVERLETTPANPFGGTEDGARVVRLPYSADDLGIRHTARRPPELGEQTASVLARFSAKPG